jgi:hypothetical protein
MHCHAPEMLADYKQFTVRAGVSSDVSTALHRMEAFCADLAGIKKRRESVAA